MHFRTLGSQACPLELLMYLLQWIRQIRQGSSRLVNQSEWHLMSTLLGSFTASLISPQLSPSTSQVPFHLGCPFICSLPQVEPVVKTESHVGLTWNKAYSIANQMSRYNKLYTKEILQKVPETSTGSQHQLDFPTEPECRQSQISHSDRVNG